MPLHHFQYEFLRSFTVWPDRRERKSTFWTTTVAKLWQPNPENLSKQQNCSSFLHYTEPQPRFLTGEPHKPLTLTKTGLTALLNETERMTEREEAMKNCFTGLCACVHTVKSTAGFYFGCFYHFGLLNSAPLEAINFKPQSLLPSAKRGKGRGWEGMGRGRGAKSNLLFLWDLFPWCSGQ